MNKKREAERTEALGHLVYFKEMLAAHELALKRMENNIKICRKNVKRWESRIEKMELKA